MLSKIFLTLAVIVGAFFVLRQRRIAEAEQNSSTPTKKAPASQAKKEDESLAADLRIGAYLFLVLMVGLGGALYYFRWQDDHTILTVNLLRENQSEPISYQVYKYQLNDRSFVTIDGTSVTVASSERMEVIGLD